MSHLSLVGADGAKVSHNAVTGVLEIQCGPMVYQGYLETLASCFECSEDVQCAIGDGVMDDISDDVDYHQNAAEIAEQTVGAMTRAWSDPW